MTVNTAATELFLTEHFPGYMQADPDSPAEVVALFTEVRARIGEMVGDASSPGPTQFDWQALIEMIDEENGGDEKRLAAADAARRLAIRWPGNASGEMRLHTGLGSFVTVSADGVPLAAEHLHNPVVPAEYGSPDPVPWWKIAEAVAVERLVHQGAEWGDGYDMLNALKHTLKLTPIGKTAHIGMATTHAQAYDLPNPGADHQALAFSGTTGRTMHPDFLHAVSVMPSMAELKRRTTFSPTCGFPTDAGAGLLDSLSSGVANRVALYGANEESHLVVLPDPSDPAEIRVDYN